MKNLFRKKREESLSEKAKQYIVDDIDLSANAFAYKFEPTDFNEELKKFAPKSDSQVEEITPKFEPKPVDFKPQETVKPESKVLICKHCYRTINGVSHIEGAYRGKMRCDPQDTMMKYGYNAEAVGTDCGSTCLGAH